MFPPDVWGVIFSKLDCPRSRLCVLLADKGMPEVLAHVNVEFTLGSTSAESRIVAREAITGRRHFGAVAKPVGLRYASQVPEEQGILFGVVPSHVHFSHCGYQSRFRDSNST